MHVYQFCTNSTFAYLPSLFLWYRQTYLHQLDVRPTSKNRTFSYRTVREWPPAINDTIKAIFPARRVETDWPAGMTREALNRPD